MVDKIELIDELVEAEIEIASGSVVSHQSAKKQILDNLSKWK